MKNLTKEEVVTAIKETIQELDINTLETKDWELVYVKPWLNTIEVKIKGVQVAACRFERKIVVKKRKFWFDKKILEYYYDVYVNHICWEANEEFGDFVYSKLKSIQLMANKNRAMEGLEIIKNV